MTTEKAQRAPFVLVHLFNLCWMVTQQLATFWDCLMLEMARRPEKLHQKIRLYEALAGTTSRGDGMASHVRTWNMNFIWNKLKLSLSPFLILLPLTCVCSALFIKHSLILFLVGMPAFTQAYFWFYRHFYRHTWKLPHKGHKLKYYECYKSSQHLSALPNNSPKQFQLNLHLPSKCKTSFFFYFKLSVSLHSHFVSAWGDWDKLQVKFPSLSLYASPGL